MSKQKDIRKNNSEAEPNNPADKGVDHNLTQGPEKDHEESYIRKQESEESRGVDNEDSTD